MSDHQVLNAFLRRYLEDQVAGRVRTLDGYQELYPGHENLIAEQHARYQGRNAAGPKAGSDGDAPATGKAGWTAFPGAIGHYRVLSELGRGGQGVVYLAEDDRLPRRVALKVLTGLGPLEPGRVARFLREAEVAARLEHHGIATVYDTGVEDGVPYIAMRYVEGETLARRIATEKDSSGTLFPGQKKTSRRGDQCRSPEASAPVSMDWRMTVRIVEGAARALHFAHEHGIIHRDVKPGNIVVTPSGDPVILDFGLARDLDSELVSFTQSGDFFGTPAYMSPEQFASHPVHADRRTDVWSLGVTLYECLTRSRPFQAPTREGLIQAILTLEPPDPCRRRPGLPQALRVILAAALMKDRDRRYLTAESFADDLRSLLENRPIAARPVPGLVRTWLWARRKPSQAALILILMIALPSISALLTSHFQSLEMVRRAKRQDLETQREELLCQGYDALEGEDMLRAAGAFQSAATLAGDSPEAVVGLALVHFRAGRPREALGVLDENRAVIDERPGAELLREDALASIEKSIAPSRAEAPPLDPRDAVDFYLLGSRQMMKGHLGTKKAFQAALEAFDRAILHSPTPRPLFYMERTHAAGHLGDTRTAVETAQAIRHLWPGSASALNGAALGLRLSGEYGLALECLERALLVRQDGPVTLIRLGETYLEMGRNEEGLLAFDRVIARLPSNAVAVGDPRAAVPAQTTSSALLGS